MTARDKKFEKWKQAKLPVDADEVNALLRRVFGARLREASGTSHFYQIEVSELKDNPKFAFGILTIPLKSGQKVKGPYLQKAYEAAVLLGLHAPSTESEKLEQKTDEPENTNIEPDQPPPVE